MGAICGILRFDGAPVDRADIARLLDAMPYRCLDGRRVWCDGPVGLGHGLVRITEEDRFEAQPLHDIATDLTLVADLRLDDREALAATLGFEAHTVSGMPDSALVLAAYRRWGEDCARHLLGDFVFAIWDGRARRLVMGRDHMGQRHVILFRNDAFIMFAPEYRALRTHAEVPRELTEAQIGGLLLLGVEGAPPVAAAGFSGLPGGTTLTVTAQGVGRERRYWEPQADPAHLGQSEAYYVAAYRRVLGEAVACRLRRLARPAGLSFSGGYDTGAIAGLAGSAMAPLGRKLIAVSSTMPDDYAGTIRHPGPWVEMCARDMPHLDLHRVSCAGRDPLSGFEAACLRIDAFPSVGHFVDAEIMEKLASLGVRLIMDGHGGDYTLNPRGQTMLAYLLRTGQLRRLLAEIRASRRLGSRLWPLLWGQVAKPLLPAALIAWAKRFRHGDVPAWGDRPINPDFARRLLTPNTEARPLKARDRTDMRGRMRNTLQRISQGRASGGEIDAAVHGLTLTRPFHDKRVVELALAIPPELYVRDGRDRYLAKIALRDIYPKEFQTRGRRNDSGAPDFLRIVKRIEPRILAEIAEMETSEKLTRYIDFVKLRRLLAARGPDDHESGFEWDTIQAVRVVLLARFIRWFEGYNR